MTHGDSDVSKEDERIGYCRPPKHGQFKPGRSGNPTGKRKGARNLGTDVKLALMTPVKIHDKGKPRIVTTQQAAMMRLREQALKGDARALDRLLALAQIFNNDPATGSLGHEAMAAEDQAILDAYAETARTRPASTSSMGRDIGTNGEGSNDG